MTDAAHIHIDRLAAVTGGIWYGEHKSKSGERWAAGVDCAAKYVYDHVSKCLGKNVTGLALLPGLTISEVVARGAGGLWDRSRGR